ncbi:MAG TPA: 50S ribosomal protein L3 N(5)-glutamine methyltransferase [Steroidobacteraceae bacterium]|nr:50S ribosomal protein L3 N(5)-glutamine methyltransferase [Steroidobacteraceae bacterium]
MRELFHTAAAGAVARARPGRRRGASPPLTVGDLIARGARRLKRARVFFGHGTDNARDEAASLTLHALRLPHGGGAALYGRRVSDAGRARVEALLKRRIAERVPAAYLTGVTWFAGLEMRVDPRVLIPRSPLAELIERRFTPWTDPHRVRSILDLGTGSGCIAIACARAFLKARVDAVDISTAALSVARENVRRHRLAGRVRLRRSDHFAALKRARYDIIVANPPYVGARELKQLPPEYRHEPRVALAAGERGLSSVAIILRQAHRHLRPNGLLIVEVGNTEGAVRRAYPRLPFLWLHFARGGGGVFLLTREQLEAR